MQSTLSPENNLDGYNPASFPTNFDLEYPTTVDIPGQKKLDDQISEANDLLRALKDRHEQRILDEPPQHKQTELAEPRKLLTLPEPAYQGSLDRLDVPPSNNYESAPTPNQTGYLGRAAVVGAGLTEQVAAAKDPSFLDS